MTRPLHPSSDASLAGAGNAEISGKEPAIPASGATARHERPLDRDEVQKAYAATGYDLEAHPAHLVRRVHQRATLSFQQVMAGEALSPTQFAALSTVLRVGQVSQNHLGRLTAMDPSTVSLVVRKLLKEGLISRGASEADQRLSIIRLTEKGTRYTLDRLERSMEVGRRVLAPLNDAEQAMFLDFLRRVGDDDVSAEAERAR